jgi:hypothetical protein
VLLHVGLQVIYVCLQVICIWLQFGSKKKQRMTALPSAAVGKATFAEGFVQVRSAHLGKLTPSRVFPAVPSVLAQGTRHSWEHPIRVSQSCRELAVGKDVIFADGLGKAVGAVWFF